MNLLLIHGDWQNRGEYLARLVTAGYTLSSADHAGEGVGEAAALRPTGLLSTLDGEADVDRAAAAVQEIGLPWLAWDCGGDAALAALRSGAVVVLPPDASPADLEQAAANSFPRTEESVPFRRREDLPGGRRGDHTGRRRQHSRGAPRDSGDAVVAAGRRGCPHGPVRPGGGVGRLSFRPLPNRPGGLLRRGEGLRHGQGGPAADG